MQYLGAEGTNLAITESSSINEMISTWAETKNRKPLQEPWLNYIKSRKVSQKVLFKYGRTSLCNPSCFK